MVDVVTNHMVSSPLAATRILAITDFNFQGYAGAGNDVDYSVFNPFNSEDYFHSYCEITDYSNVTNAEQCWEGDTTVSLPDLNTESETVQNMWNDWITELVSNYSSETSPIAYTRF